MPRKIQHSFVVFFDFKTKYVVRTGADPASKVRGRRFW